MVAMRLALVFLLVLLRLISLAAQTNSTDSPVVPARTDGIAANGSGTSDTGAASIPAEPPVLDLVQQSLVLDIATGTYYSLLAWVRQLGLAESGTANDLRQRLYAHYGLKPPGAALAAGRTILIETADSTEYLTLEEDGSTIIRLSGRVSLLVSETDGGDSHSIKADEIVYNRDTNQLLARGRIVYERKRSGGSDLFMGNLLSIDMNDWSGIFVDGKNTKGGGSTAQAAAGSTRFVFEAEEILRKTDTVLLFKDGRITSSVNPDPNFSIRASRIWILGGKEWAIANATLFVGELPVLYIPFFYYPGQEIVFHPVFGFREREGRLVQTTTYLLGEKPEKKETISLFNLTEGEGGYVRKVEGFFIQNTAERKTGGSNDFIKLFADIYTHLGASVGVQAQLDKLAFLQGFRSRAALAVSRTVYLRDGVYSPFIPQNGYESDWNTVNLLGNELPFRFLLDLAFNARFSAFTLRSTLAFLSDPFFPRDFNQRSEDMDWLKFLRQPVDENPPGKQGSFQQRFDVSGSLNFKPLAPWLGPISLSRLGLSLVWTAKPTLPPIDSVEKLRLEASPMSEFFVPDSLVIVDTGLALSGRLFEYPRPVRPVAAGSGPQSTASAAAAAGNPLDFLADLPQVLAPWQELPVAQTGTVQAPVSPEKQESGFQTEELLKPLGLVNRKPLVATLNWQLNPAFKWDGRYNTAAWKQPDEIDWQLLYELQSITLGGSANLSTSFYDALLRANLVLSGSTRTQLRPRYLEDPAYVSTALLAAWKRQDAQFRSDSLSSTLTLTGSPLQDYWLFAPSSLSWNLGAALYDFKFETMDGDLPVYATLRPEWTKERIRDHSFKVELAARPANLRQSIGLQATLPPLLESYSFNFGLQLPSVQLSGQSRYYRPKAEDHFEWAPITSRLILGAAPWPVLTANLTYDPKQDRVNSLVTRFAWQNLSFESNHAYTKDFSLDRLSGWIPGEDAFRLSALALSYKQEIKPVPFWYGRIQLTGSIGLDARQNVLRFAESSMNFNLAFSFKIHEILSLTFSSVSQNNALWRYYPWLFDLPAEFDNLKALNPITDIANGFRFFDPDDSRRRASLFKLKSLNFTALHSLEDWDLSFSLSATPFLNRELAKYEFRTSFSVLIAWKSVPEIKTEIKRTDNQYVW